MARRRVLPWATQPPNPQLDLNHPLVLRAIDVWTPDSPSGHVSKTLIKRLNPGASVINAGAPGIGFTTGPGGRTTANTGIVKGLDTGAFLNNLSEYTMFALFESFDTIDTGGGAGPFGEAFNGFTWHGGSNSQSAVVSFTNLSLATATVYAAFGPFNSFAKNVPVLWVSTASIFGAGLKAFTNGKLITTTATPALNFIVPSGNVLINTNNGNSTWNGRVYLAGVIGRAWTDSEVFQFSANPWQILQPQSRMATGIAGTVSTISRPGADVSVVGWSFTGSSLSASINEVTRNDASYIEAAYGVTGAIVTLDIPRSPGNHTISFTSEYLVGFASSGQFKFSLLDDTNTVLGTTGWQAVTSIIVQYDLPVTISSTATRLKIEIQA